jgi:hypothetical protein
MKSIVCILFIISGLFNNCYADKYPEKKVCTQSFASATNICTSHFLKFQYLYSCNFSVFNRVYIQ